MDRIDPHIGTIQNPESDGDNLPVFVGDGSGKGVFRDRMIHGWHDLAVDGTGRTL